MRFAYRLKQLVNKVLLKIKQTKKAKKAKKDILLQNEVAKKLDNYITDFLSGKIERFSAVPKKPGLVGKKILWQYWHQGVDENTPNVVISSFNSVKKNNGGYDIILITGKNIEDYVGLPDFVYKKLNIGGFNLTKLSNLVRLYLLSAYGGVWLDATVYLTKPIAENWLQKDFFAPQRSQTQPTNADAYTKFDPLYFNWSQTAQVRMLNSFMIAKPNNKIVGDLLSILLEYWRREPQIQHYFFFQICFNRMMQNDVWKSLNCEITGDTDCQNFQLVAFDRFEQSIYDAITAKSNIHKLTLYWSRKKIPVGSFADFIVNGKGKD